MEKYSVLMSIYKKVKADELELSIHSMLNQTVPPEQFIIVFDGPVGDELESVVQMYIKKNADIFTVVRLCNNSGLAIALNEGLKYARNDLIARMDSDDYSLPNRCECQLKMLAERTSLVLLGTNTQHFIDNHKKPLNEFGVNPVGLNQIKRTICRNSAFSHPTVMFRKSAVDNVGGYDPILVRSQDHDLFSRLIYYGYDVDNINDVLLLFRDDNSCKLRNRSNESCKARIIIQRRLFKRKQCSLFDYLYIVCGVVAMKIMPEKIYVFVYSKLKDK